MLATYLVTTAYRLRTEPLPPLGSGRQGSLGPRSKRITYGIFMRLN